MVASTPKFRCIWRMKQEKMWWNSWKKGGQRCFSSFPKNVTSERPFALVSTMIGWWKALRAPKVAKWQVKCRMEWHGTDGRNGGAERLVWETLLEMERFKYQAGEKIKER